jgi:hypothetical protein
MRLLRSKVVASKYGWQAVFVAVGLNATAALLGLSIIKPTRGTFILRTETIAVEAMRGQCAQLDGYPPESKRGELRPSFFFSPQFWHTIQQRGTT